MRLEELTRLFEHLAPPEYACEWDNVGLLAGYHEKEIKRVFIALDATDQVVEDAIRFRADLLLTHHPLIFKPMKQINDSNFIARRLLGLIEYNVAYYAMHTNFDHAPGCMADLAAERLGLTDCQVLAPEGTGDNGIVYGAGRTGVLSKPMTIRQLGELVKSRFGLPFLTAYGCADSDDTVSRVAVCPGSGGSMMKDALRTGASVYLTGDISHHQGIDAVAEGLIVMDAGHYGLEHIFISFMKEFLEQNCEGGLEEIRTAALHFPLTVL